MATLKTNGGLGELGKFLVENGHNVPDEISKQYEEPKNDSNRSFDELFDTNLESQETKNLENEAENIINEAEELLEEVSGIPGAENNDGEPQEAPTIIVDVASEPILDTGIISEQDMENRQDDLDRVVSEEIKLDEKIEELEEVGANEETIEKAKRTKSFLLGQADKIIREMSPELFSKINEADYEIIRKVEDLFDTLNSKRKVPVNLANGKAKNIKINKTAKIKLAELLRNNRLTEEEAGAYEEAEQRRASFARDAALEGIPEDAARAIYRTHIDFVNELRDSEPGDYYALENTEEDSKNAEILEDIPVPESEDEKDASIDENPSSENVIEQNQEGDTTSAEWADNERPTRTREKVLSLNEIQLKKYEELVSLYEECAQKTAQIKDEKEREEAEHFLANLKKEVDGMPYHKGNYADNLIIAHKFATHDQIRKLNYILEQETPAQENIALEKNKLSELSNSFKKLIGRLADKNERKELLSSAERLENRISEIGDEDTEENRDKLLRLNEYAIGLKLDIDSAFGLIKKDNPAPIISEPEEIPPVETISVDEVPVPDSSEVIPTQDIPEIAVPSPEANEKEEFDKVDFDKEAEALEDRVKEIAKESKEKDLSDFERKIEKLRDTVVRCTELASTIRDVDTRRDIMSAINKLIGNVEGIYEDENLNEKQKSSRIHSNLKKLLLDIDKAHKPKGKPGVSPSENADKSGRIENVLETKERKSGEAKPISEKVYSEYEKVGVGLDTLKELEGFNELSAGQQLLMLKNYNSALYDKMNVDSQNELATEWNNKNITQKIGYVGLNIITLGSTKKRKQKEVASRLLAGGRLDFENRKNLLQSLVGIAKESPTVHIDRNGEIQIEYVDSEKYSNDPEAYGIISSYNEAASRYAAIPRNWFDNNIDFNGKTEEQSFYSKLLGPKHAFLSGKERAVLSDAKNEYEEARENYINLVLEQMGDTPENRRQAMKELNTLDEKVKMNQLFVSDPRAEQLLQDTRDASIFNQTMSEFMSKRGQYMGYGILTRIAAVATITSIAAPVGLAVVGGMSYLRGKREVRDMLKMRRVNGSLSEKDLKEEMVYTVDLHESLGNIKASLEDAKGRGDRAEEARLAVRMEEVKDKIGSGHNFERRTRQLGEFRDAKFFSNRVENLVVKYELLKNTPGQEKEAELIEFKIAQTATLMRELMNNSMLHFGVNGDNSKTVTNRLSFIQALSLADATISLDTTAIEKKMATIVGLRRENLDDLGNKRGINHCKSAVVIAAAFGSAGYAIAHAAGSFFGGEMPTSSGVHDAIPSKAPNIVDNVQNENTSSIKDSLKDSLKEGIEKVSDVFGREQVNLPEGIYTVHDGESLSSIIIAHNPELLDIPPNAQSNAIKNFLYHLDVQKIREIGLSTNPEKVTAGQQINLAKLEDYFGSMRVDGKSFIERALQATGEKIVDVPSVNEEVARVATPAPVIENAEVDDVLTPVEARVENSNFYGSLEDLEKAWPTLSVAEKAASWDFIIPEYIARHIGSANDEFIAMADKVDASELSEYIDGASASDSDSKGHMLKAVADALKSRGITPDEGYEYGGKNLRDYVSQVYRSKIMTKGLDSIK